MSKKEQTLVFTRGRHYLSLEWVLLAQSRGVPLMSTYAYIFADRENVKDKIKAGNSRKGVRQEGWTKCTDTKLAHVCDCACRRTRGEKNKIKLMGCRRQINRKVDYDVMDIMRESGVGMCQT